MSRIATINDVEKMTRQPTPAFGHLIDGIAVARGNDRWDLVERCAILALASVTGEAPDRDIYDAARQMAIARLRDITFDELAQALPIVANEIGSRPHFITERANKAVRFIEEELQDLALLLLEDSAPNLIASAARLRKLDRPDLAITASTRAIDRNGTVPVALTTRAAAHLDRHDVDLAEDDVVKAERARPSFFTANVLARLEIGRRNLPAAESWALLANERDANGTAGALSMMKIRTIQERFDEAEEWAGRAGRRANWSVDWMRLQAANELLRGGQRHDAEAILQDLWQSNSYTPARRRLLELNHPAAA